MAVIGITFTVRPLRRVVEITKVTLPAFLPDREMVFARPIGSLSLHETATSGGWKVVRSIPPALTMIS
jgi:hypothetical protein